MSKRGENIYKRKDGRWEGRYIKEYVQKNGKVKPFFGYVYARSYREVREKLLPKKAEQLIENRKSIYRKNMENDPYYAEAADAWIFAARAQVKESTRMCYLHILEKHIKPFWKHYHISQITTCSAERFVEETLRNGNLKNGGPLSPKTMQDILLVFKRTMTYAASHGAEINCNLNLLTIKYRPKPMRVLSKAEQNRLTQELCRNMDHYSLGILLSLYTGIRIGELCALKWKHIKLQEGILEIRETLQRIRTEAAFVSDDQKTSVHTKILLSSPKSSYSLRDIPLALFLCQILQEHQKMPESFLLTGKEDIFVEPRTMQNHFKAFLKSCGIADANFHALRHTFATRCVEAGFETKSLSEILGHSSVNITLNRYVHSSFDLKIQNINKAFSDFEPSAQPSKLPGSH